MAAEDSRAPRLYLYLRIIQLFFACLLEHDFCLARINISSAYTRQAITMGWFWADSTPSAAVAPHPMPASASAAPPVCLHLSQSLALD